MKSEGYPTCGLLYVQPHNQCLDQEIPESSLDIQVIFYILYLIPAVVPLETSRVIDGWSGWEVNLPSLIFSVRKKRKKIGEGYFFSGDFSCEVCGILPRTHGKLPCKEKPNWFSS